MKTALITTTIRIPHVLSLYRAYDSDVRFFVAMDKKTPVEAYDFFEDFDNAYVIPPVNQDRWKCSELIGWNCIQRRNIALLEAIKWGADFIVSVDDDNIPIENYMEFVHHLALEQNGGAQVIPDRWFNVGDLTTPHFLQRGIPDAPAHPYTVSSITNQRVGVAQGICFGDPDCSAHSRIVEHQPPVRVANELLRSGVLFKPAFTKWTIFNTQSTAMIRELAPAWFCPPALGRFDDIVASLITQRIMRETNHAIHFGSPFFYQQRNFHDLSVDLEQERWGTEHIEHVAQLLDSFELSGSTTVVEHCARLWYRLADGHPWFPNQAIEAAFAFLEDVEPLL